MRTIVCLCGIAALSLASAQPQPRPAVNEGGVLNAASYQASGPQGVPLGPGSLASIYGTGLSGRVEAASAFPLPKRLGGAEVYVDGIPAPLLFVSPLQVNFQLPAGLMANRYTNAVPVEIVVVTSSGASEPRRIRAGTSGFGLFTSGAGCAAPAIVAGADGRLITPQSSAQPGEILTFYGTGFGLGYFYPEDGMPNPGGKSYDPQINPPVEVPLRLGAAGVGSQFSTVEKVAGYAGLEQIKIVLEPSTARGCTVPVRIGNSEVTQTVSIPVGGGACSDAPPDRRARFRWVERTAGAIREARFDAELMEARGVLPNTPRTLYTLGTCRCYSAKGAPPPLCGPAAYIAHGFDLGSVRLSAPGIPQLVVRPPDVSGVRSYSTTLSASRLGEGTATVISSGSGSVGSFSSAVTLGEPITITNNWTPQTKFPLDQAVTVNWRNGDASSQVTARFSGGNPGSETTCVCTAPASAGTVTLPLLPGFGGHMPIPPRLPVYPVHQIDVIVGPLQPVSLTVPGITAGGEHTWARETTYTFQ